MNEMYELGNEKAKLLQVKWIWERSRVMESAVVAYYLMSQQEANSEHTQ